MKKNNKKLLTLILAGALCVSTLSGVAAMKGITSSAADNGKWELGDIFVKESNAAYSITDDDNKDMQITLRDNSVIRTKRNLALKWFDGKDSAKYLNFKFALADTNFESVSFKVETTSAVANADNKAINTVKFVNNNGTVSVYVFEGEEETGDETKYPVDVVGKTAKIELAAGENDGEFGVKLTVGDAAAISIGSFKNVGANYAEYTAGSMVPFAISATIPTNTADDKNTTVVALKELNGQTFGNLTEEDGKYYVQDNASPVLVVNEDVAGFLLGTKFSLDYKAIDVLQSLSLSDEKTYYQYNPADTELTDEKYVKLSTDVTFLDTAYTKEDGTQTTVYREDGKEYVSIKITLGDNRGTDSKTTYDLSWYATDDAVVSKNDVEYIIIDRNTQGPSYQHIVATKNEADDKGTNVVDEDKLNAEVEDYQKKLDEAAKDVYVNSDITLPSLERLFYDNNGYRNLKFTISYKTPGSDSTKLSTNLAYNGLKLTVDYEGEYEFKVFANDKAGNKMMYYDENGDLTAVDSTNVWDLDEIPTFGFTIENQGMKADPTTTSTKSYRLDEEDVGDRYTFSDVKIVGATNVKETYKLYRIDADKARAIGLGEDELAAITYANLAEKVADAIKTHHDDYIGGVYLGAYADLLSEKLGADVTKDQVLECFEEINEYDSRITEDNNADAWNRHNRYNWTIDSQCFTAVETGNFVILADYWEMEIPTQRVAAYKVITVEEKSDGTDGETTSWVEQNIVSVILFGIAGVLLIIVIILLFVKPSDETLEDLDKKAVGAKKAKKDDNK